MVLVGWWWWNGVGGVVLDQLGALEHLSQSLALLGLRLGDVPLQVLNVQNHVPL